MHFCSILYRNLRQAYAYFNTLSHQEQQAVLKTMSPMIQTHYYLLYASETHIYTPTKSFPIWTPPNPIYFSHSPQKGQAQNDNLPSSCLINLINDIRQYTLQDNQGPFISYKNWIKYSMKSKEKRLESIHNDLVEIYQDLFGENYAGNSEVDEGTQFKSIIERFREKHFFIRQMQKDREKKEKKGKLQVVDQLQKNEKIRDEIKKCQELIKHAEQRINNGLKIDNKESNSRIVKIRVKLIESCHQMLNDVKNVEYGESYKDKKTYRTLGQLKTGPKNNQTDEINMEEELALQKFKKNDEKIEDLLVQLINANKVVMHEAQTAKAAIDSTSKMIQTNLDKVQKLNLKVRKGNSQLLEVLKNYRRPNKFCLDIILILLLLALVGIIINMVKS